MGKHIGKWPIIKVGMAAETVCELWFDSPPIARDAKPGQFVHIMCGGRTLLRRPISICDVEGDAVRVMFGLMGEGTRWLAERRPGDTLDVMGPLGTGFTLGDTSRDIVVVGGGLGVFPLLMAAKQFTGAVTAILGFRARELVTMEVEFGAVCAEVNITTDDGSYGHHGVVTDLLPDAVRAGASEALCCGPTPMLRAVAKVCRDLLLPCQVSLEERMGCGVGACYACAVKAKRGSEEIYAQVCRNGPVFKAEEVFFE